MASQANAFSLLTGAEAQLNAKKKKKQAQAKAQAQAAPSAPQQNGTAAAAPAAPVPVSAEPVRAPVPPPSADLIVGVMEASAVFERAAREARSPADKLKLWREWTRLVRAWGMPMPPASSGDARAAC